MITEKSNFQIDSIKSSSNLGKKFSIDKILQYISKDLNTLWNRTINSFFITKSANTANITISVDDNQTISADLTNTTVVAGTKGDASNSAQITVDAKGRITNIINVPISSTSTLSAVLIAGSDAGGTQITNFPQIHNTVGTRSTWLYMDSPLAKQYYLYATNSVPVNGGDYAQVIGNTTTVDNPNVSINVYSGLTISATTLSVSKTNVLVTSTHSTFQGTIYGADYSANYTIRSLVDKGYADNLVANVTSGVYTPTAGNNTNLDANPTPTQAQYLRDGSVVTVSGRFTANPTNPAILTSFSLTLPVASNIGVVADLAGTAFCGSISGQGAEIIGNIAGDYALVQWISADVTNQTWSYIFQYRII